MGMVSGILPVVGVPLPFVSYGGTAMVTPGAGAGHSHVGGAQRQEPAKPVRRCSALCRVGRVMPSQAVQGLGHTRRAGLSWEGKARGVLSLTLRCSPWRQSSSSRKRPTTSLFFNLLASNGQVMLDQPMRPTTRAPVPCRASRIRQKHAPDDARFRRLSARNGAPLLHL